MNNLQTQQLKKFCKKVRSEYPIICENLEDYIDDTLSYNENIQNLKQYIPISSEQIAQNLKEHYLQFVEQIENFNDIVEELSNILTSKENSKKTSEQQTAFDILLMKLKEKGTIGFKPKLFLNGFIKTDLTLTDGIDIKEQKRIKEKIWRMIRNSKILNIAYKPEIKEKENLSFSLNSVPEKFRKGQTTYRISNKVYYIGDYSRQIL